MSLQSIFRSGEELAISNLKGLVISIFILLYDHYIILGILLLVLNLEVFVIILHWNHVLLDRVAHFLLRNF